MSDENRPPKQTNESQLLPLIVFVTAYMRKPLSTKLREKSHTDMESTLPVPTTLYQTLGPRAGCSPHDNPTVAPTVFHVSLSESTDKLTADSQRSLAGRAMERSNDGMADGCPENSMVGNDDGCAEKMSVGWRDGIADGVADGSLLGSLVGRALGSSDGVELGCSEGDIDGCQEGD